VHILTYLLTKINFLTQSLYLCLIY